MSENVSLAASALPAQNTTHRRAQAAEIRVADPVLQRMFLDV